MATPYEFIARQLQRQFPGGVVAPLTEESERPRADWVERVYRSGTGEGFSPDYTRLSLSYPGGYPYYYPLHVTLPHQRPLVLRVASGAEALSAFTRADSEVRACLARYGYWRIEAAVDPATTDFWILMLPRPDGFPQHLILPTAKLRQLLDRAHNPEKFSLFLAKDGLAFAAQPLPAAQRLALLREPELLATEAFHELDMSRYLNNWLLLVSP